METYAVQHWATWVFNTLHVKAEWLYWPILSMNHHHVKTTQYKYAARIAKEGEQVFLGKLLFLKRNLSCLGTSAKWSSYISRYLELRGSFNGPIHMPIIRNIFKLSLRCLWDNSYRFFLKYFSTLWLQERKKKSFVKNCLQV